MRLLFFILILNVAKLSSQNSKIDSITNRLSNAADDTTRVKDLIALGQEYGAVSNYAEAAKLLQKALSLARRLRFYRGEGLAHYILAEHNLEQGYYKEALADALPALEIRKKAASKKGVLLSCAQIASAYDYLGNYPESMKYELECLRLAEELNDRQAISSAYSSIAATFGHMNQHDKALSYYNKSLRVLEEMGKKEYYCYVYNNIANVYAATNDLTRALQYYEKSLKLFKIYGPEQAVATTELNIGILYSKINRYEEALRLLKSCMKVWIKHGNKRGELVTANAMAGLLLKQNQLNAAEELLNRGEAIAKETASLDYLTHNYQIRSALDSTRGDFKSAYYYYNLFISCRDSLNNEEVAKKTLQSQLKYEFEKKTVADSLSRLNETRLKNTEIEKQKAEISAEKNKQYALYGGLALFLIFSGFMYNRFKVTTRQKKIIELKETETSKQNEIIWQQTQVLEEKQREMLDSIRYAKRIQSSLLPREKYIHAAISRLAKRGLALYLFWLPVYVNCQSPDLDSLMEVRRTTREDTTRLAANLLIGERYFLTRPDTALKYWTEAIEFYKAINISGRKAAETRQIKNLYSQLLNNSGYIYDNMGNVPKALEYYNASLRILEEINDSIGLGYAYNNLGIIYRKQGNLDNAEKFLVKSLQVRQASHDTRGEAQSYTNVGYIFELKRQYAKAGEYYAKSIRIRESNGDKNGLGYSYQFMGNLFIAEGQLDSALNYFSKSLKIRREINDLRGLAITLNKLGFVYLKKGNTGIALKYAEENRKLAEQLKYPETIMHAAFLLKELHARRNNYKAALAMHKLYTLMHDSINSTETRKAALRSQLNYEYEKKALADSLRYAFEAGLKNAQIQAQSAELKAKRNHQYVLFGGISLVILFSAFVFQRYRLTSRQKKIIEIKEQEAQTRSRIISRQKFFVQEKQKEIIDSIHYAERIQKAFLKSEKSISKSLNKIRS